MPHFKGDASVTACFFIRLGAHLTAVVSPYLQCGIIPKRRSCYLLTTSLWFNKCLHNNRQSYRRTHPTIWQVLTYPAILATILCKYGCREDYLKIEIYILSRRSGEGYHLDSKSEAALVEKGRRGSE